MLRRNSKGLQMLKIALIGHDTRNDNLGVGALTVSEIELIRSIARRRGLTVQVMVLCGRGARPTCIVGKDVVERTVRPLQKPWDFFAAVREADLVIDISGGDSFSDIYGNRRIFQILLQKFLVHFANRPMVMAPQTIGPFKYTIWRILALQSIRRCAVVATRDNQSTQVLRAMGVRSPIVEASDIALRLPYEAPVCRKDRVKVGINVSGLLMHGGYTGANMFGLKDDYPSLIRNLIRQFLDLPDPPDLHLVGHVIPRNRGGIEDDYQACLDLQKQFSQTTVAPAFRTPSEAKSYISGLDFFVGARMHACIAAFSSKVPVVPMAYSRKFSGLFGALGYDEIVDCTAESAADILEKIMMAFRDRQKLEREISNILDTGLRRLDRYDEALEKKMLQLS